MSTVAVIGGTGTIGRHIVAALERRGAGVRVISRHSPDRQADLATGAGLDAALAGCQVVVNASNGSPRRPGDVIVDGTRRLADAAARAGVGHMVLVSIVGIDRLPMGYYRAKLTQEQLVREAPTPWSIVRSTQFHELVLAALDVLGRLRLAPRSPARLQPVAAREAAAPVVQAALGPPTARIADVAGPVAEELTALAAAASEHRGRRPLAVPVPLLGRMGAALRAGALTCPEPDARGATTFRSWLAEPRQS